VEILHFSTPNRDEERAIMDQPRGELTTARHIRQAELYLDDAEEALGNSSAPIDDLAFARVHALLAIGRALVEIRGELRDRLGPSGGGHDPRIEVAE
jgi:hypothetical protein